MALGNCYDEPRRPKDAEKCLKRALAYCGNKHRSTIQFNLGNSLFDQERYNYLALPRSAQSERYFCEGAKEQSSSAAVCSGAHASRLRQRAKAGTLRPQRGMGPALAFTPATATDGEFLYRLTEQTMRGYVEAVWGKWNEQMVRESTSKAARDGSFQLISQNGVTVGAMRVERFPDHIRLDQLYVAAPYQRRGIGTEIVRNLMTEARSAEKPLRLRVLKTNPAKALYGRLGFVVTETTNEHYYMEYKL